MTFGRIMVVEDERIVALDLRKQLSNLGYNVVALAASGQTAIEKAQLTKPDLVLMDINLEGDIDGIDTAKALWEQLRIPVVFVTALAEDATIARAQAAKPFGYLVKPTDPREVNATIQSALSRRQAECELELREERLRLAIHSADLGVWEWDMTTNILTTHGHFNAVLGLDLDIPVTTFDDFVAAIHTMDRLRFKEALQSIGKHGGFIEETFRSAKHSFPPRYLTLDAQTYDSNRAVGTLRHATARRNVENRLSTTATLYDTIPESVAILKTDGSILSVNPAFEKAIGYVGHEVINRPLDEVLQTSYHTRPFDNLQCPSTDASWCGEIIAKRRNGETFTAWVNMGVVCSPTNEPTHIVASITDISAVQHLREQWRELAHHDALTGMANRLLLHDRLAQAITRAERNHHQCAILFIDLDQFKSVNDSLGHAVGDQLLQLTAQRINGILRSCDTLARLGGDEFVVVAGDCETTASVSTIAEKILETVTQIATVDTNHINISASIGIALFPNDGIDAPTLLSNADRAMYHAKQSGRNRYCFYAEQMMRLVTEQVSMEETLRQALQRNEFRLQFQPIFSFQNNKIAGIEALVRWQHPTRGLLLPEHFIAAAEECGVMVQLGHWILRSACLRASVLRSNGANFRLCVNISQQQLLHQEFATSVQEILWETGFPGAFLELEIAENTMQNIEQIRPMLERLRKLGITLAVDNFSAEYAPLNALKNLPINRIKLSRSVVSALRLPTADSSIATAIGQYASTLNIPTTALGIEQKIEFATLKKIGFTEGQGHYYSYPVGMPTLLDKIHNPANSGSSAFLQTG